MNDHDLDLLGRRAAAAVRADADAIADSRAALDRLLAGPPAGSGAGSGPATIAVATSPAGATAHMRRWRVFAAAAVVVMVVLGVAWLARSGSGTIDIVGPGPGSGSGVPLPTGVTTMPPDTGSPEGSTGPATSAAGSSSPPSAPAAQQGSTSAVPDTAVPDATAPADPFAGVAPPSDPSPPTVDDVPLLLPAVPAAPDRTMVSESESGALSPTLSQLWVRADGSGRVDAVVQLTTRLAPAAPAPGGDLIIVDGWPDARLYAGAPGAVVVNLVAASGVVDVRAYGLEQPAVLDIASELRAAAAGWESTTLATPPWVHVDTAWSTGFADRRLVSLDDSEGDIDSEVHLTRGWSMADLAPGFLDRTVSVVQVGDRTGLLFVDGVSGLIVRRDDGTVVRLGSRDPEADLVSVAESLEEVDQATWDAASELTIDRDGCLSLFC